jgi:hypothetical protein
VKFSVEKRPPEVQGAFFVASFEVKQNKRLPVSSGRRSNRSHKKKKRRTA